jgi:Flp pilus assembly protein TadD
MKCTQCQAPIAAADRFCGECGRANAPKTLEQISEVYLHGDPVDARDLLVDYVQRAPKDAEGWLILGNAQRDLKEDDEAEKAYMVAIQLDPRCNKAHNGLGRLYDRKGFQNEAYQFYQLATQVKSDWAPPYSSMAVIELQRGNLTQALALAQKAYQLDPQNATIAANLSIANHRNGRLKERDRLYQEAKKLGYAQLSALEAEFRGPPGTRRQ